MLAGGLFNVHLRGSGHVALCPTAIPVRLDVGEAATFADPQAAIAWSGGVTTNLKADVQAKCLIGMGSGESFQLGFAGEGWVLGAAARGPRGGHVLAAAVDGECVARQRERDPGDYHGDRRRGEPEAHEYHRGEPVRREQAARDHRVVEEPHVAGGRRVVRGRRRRARRWRRRSRGTRGSAR